MPARVPLVLVIAVAAFLAVWFVRSATEGPARLKIDDVRLVNYYPASHGWELMWTRWDPAGMAADFERIADLEANTVRLIVQPDAFGYPEPRPAMLDRLDRAIELADAAGLRVQLTLFDHWSTYGDERGSELWASRILARYHGDARIAFIELKNEIAAGDPRAMAWARALLPYVQDLADSTPVTLSPAGRGNAATLQKLKQGLRGADPDFWNIHVFARPDRAYATLAAAKAVAAPLPLLIGETGYATIPGNPRDPRIADSRAMQEAWQGHYLRTIAHAARSLDLPVPAPWTLYDFAPGAIPAQMRISAIAYQYHYGLLRTDGSAKPGYGVAKAAFDGQAIDESVNNGFERGALEAGRSLPLEWLLGIPNGASYFRSTSIAHSGRASACIRASAGDASYYATPIDTQVSQEVVYRAAAWVRGIDASGETNIAIAWYDIHGLFLGQYQSRHIAVGTTGWRQLSVAGSPPPGAASYRLYLKSAGNAGTACFDDLVLF